MCEKCKIKNKIYEKVYTKCWILTTPQHTGSYQNVKPPRWLHKYTIFYYLRTIATRFRCTFKNTYCYNNYTYARYFFDVLESLLWNRCSNVVTELILAVAIFSINRSFKISVYSITVRKIISYWIIYCTFKFRTYNNFHFVQWDTNITLLLQYNNLEIVEVNKTLKRNYIFWGLTFYYINHTKVFVPTRSCYVSPLPWESFLHAKASLHEEHNSEYNASPAIV